MCTVVARWDGCGQTQILALRDELTGRSFDDPAAWWPDLPDVVGGRDRLAGGTWCASRIGSGVIALVLNRPPKRIADPGAPSRGVLPLAGVRHGADWPSHVELAGMASFALVLATPERLVSWVFDGENLIREDHQPGTQMFTSGGAEDGKAERYVATFDAADFPGGWRALVQSAPPADDPAALVVRHQRGDDVYATVFGQLIESHPGDLRIEYSREPWTAGSWVAARYRPEQA
jgi:hypothetical protein